MRVTRILFILLLLSSAATAMISLVLFHVLQRDSGALDEDNIDVVGIVSIMIRMLVMTGLCAPGVFLNGWKWVRETGLFRFLAFALTPMLIVVWVSVFFRDRANWDIWLVQSSVFLAAQLAAYLWFSSVVRGNS
jgi:hypothetical protein